MILWHLVHHTDSITVTRRFNCYGHGVRCELCDVQTLTEWLALTGPLVTNTDSEHRNIEPEPGLGSILGTCHPQQQTTGHWTLALDSCYKAMSHRQQQLENIEQSE